MGMTMIETGRLRLRPWDPADAPALYELASDPAIGPAAGWPPHGSVEESSSVIETVLSGPLQFAIELGEPVGAHPAGALAGAIGLKGSDESRLVAAVGELEAGYWMGRPFWGHGLASEALAALIAHARDELGVRRIWAAHMVGNDRSRRVMERCGLAYVRTDAAVPFPLIGEVHDEDVLARDL